jgi:hypothetical protein
VSGAARVAHRRPGRKGLHVTTDPLRQLVDARRTELLGEAERWALTRRTRRSRWRLLALLGLLAVLLPQARSENRASISRACSACAGAHMTS